MALSSPVAGGSGGNPFSYTCPTGAYITQIDGKSGTLVDGFSVKCSDGSASPRFGGLGGTGWGDFSPTGFTGASLKGSSNYLVNMQMKNEIGPLTAHGGVAGTLYDWVCPSGKINSVTGAADAYVNRAQFGCTGALTEGVHSSTSSMWGMMLLFLIIIVSAVLLWTFAPTRMRFTGGDDMRDDGRAEYYSDDDE